MTAWLVGWCILLAVLLLAGDGPLTARTPARRLRALASAPGAPRAWLARSTPPRARPPRARKAPGPDGRPVRLGRRGARGGGGEVATLVDELSVLLRSGLPPARAWSALPATPDLLLARAVRSASAAAAGGRDIAAALRAGAREQPGPVATVSALDGLAATWHVAQRTGAPTADVLVRYADALRSEVDASDARQAALAAPRATARILAALPPAGLLLGVLVGADPVSVLLGTVPGRVCAGVGAACTAAGWWWTRRLLAAAERPEP